MVAVNHRAAHTKGAISSASRRLSKGAAPSPLGSGRQGLTDEACGQQILGCTKANPKQSEGPRAIAEECFGIRHPL